ncbi:diaminopimelate epimerase (dapF) [Methanocaldococcus jannaschii DSM 2661]|uniref:Diaminopimelate epimerase n=1 Tax=Methanocaldococcus jannaschii (strain ATCC 43067 / DSM 2661 / JAL-1 / JCM 10045 / NBRC 100440) TaxID=243232 RepID=DAPF_METJA|nr:diaminopimelate epimerase [Methanocaldococcus jannaschii]Q58519.1 RecName: Full=Diaminopimelate epimerase; Short=DAP epimerase; AltName: Full=PLP-independent amino acid racemase [Methanocaldococcus jannaschii DSM 2661]AAB99120.1 diaminopimelate epimerase (dapF) [Methanocaldococcus jannaschii DSM 2661]
MEFTKMHALGNDYIVINEFDGEKVKEEEKAEFSRKICRRGFSVGADGVIFIQKPTSDEYDVRFRIFNSDGSEAEMCGNGIRCFSKYVYERIMKKNPLKVETKGGLRVSEMEIEGDEVKKIKVYMGVPKFKLKDIPMVVDGYKEDDEFLNGELKLKNPYLPKVKLSVVNVGNPHAVIFVEDNNIDLDFVREHLDVIGKEIEHHEAFPERINVHFVKVLNPNEIRIVTWERGAGYTTACGTGTTASVIMAHKLGKTNNRVLAHLDGGDLEIEIKDDGVYMIGDAVMVYDAKLINIGW